MKEAVFPACNKVYGDGLDTLQEERMKDGADLQQIMATTIWGKLLPSSGIIQAHDDVDDDRSIFLAF